MTREDITRHNMTGIEGGHITRDQVTRHDIAQEEATRRYTDMKHDTKETTGGDVSRDMARL